MKRCVIAFEKYADMGEKIIFPAYDHNCLYSMDKDSGEVEFLERIPKTNLFGIRTFFSVTEYENKVVLIPFNDFAVWIYDLGTGEFHIIPIKRTSEFDKINNIPTEGVFSSSARFGNRVFLFPHYYPAVVEINMDDYNVSYFQAPIEELDSRKVSTQPYITNIFVREEYAYCAVGNSNNMLIWNMRKETYEIWGLKYSGCGFNGVFKEEDDFIFVPRTEGAVLVWNKKENTYREFNNYPQNFKCSGIPFHTAVKVDGKILLVANQSDQMVELKFDTWTMESIEGLSDLVSLSPKGYATVDNIMAFGTDETVFWFINGVERTFCSFEVRSKVFKSVQLYCNNEKVSILDIVESRLKTSSISLEENGFDLEDFLLAVTKG